MSEQGKHSPTPWSVGHFSASDSVDGENAMTVILSCVNENGDGATVAEVNRWSYGDDLPTPESEANAALIVTAVNAHADLLAACEAAATALQWHAEQDDTSTLAEAYRHLVAAIRKAKGQS